MLPLFTRPCTFPPVTGTPGWECGAGVVDGDDGIAGWAGVCAEHGATAQNATINNAESPTRLRIALLSIRAGIHADGFEGGKVYGYQANGHRYPIFSGLLCGRRLPTCR